MQVQIQNPPSLTNPVLSCSKDDGLGSFEGVKQYDENGSPLGCYGECDDDWTNFELSDTELALFDFSDNVDLSGEGDDVVVNRIAPFPNPVVTNQIIAFDIVGAARLKIVIVNMNEEVVYSDAIRVDTTFPAVLLEQGVYDDLPKREIHRLYYLMTNASGETVFSGYGDISVCEQGGALENCY